MDALGELDIAQGAILLQELKNTAVEFVQLRQVFA
jgi:hypothetical protein